MDTLSIHHYRDIAALKTIDKKVRSKHWSPPNQIHPTVFQQAG